MSCRLIVLLTLVVLPALPAAAEEPAVYRVPVEGELVSPFDPPEHRYGPGHRGVDLAAAPGSPIVAAAEGVVAFAGAVAGDRWVAIEHLDGVRTTYGPLAEIAVSRGQPVAGGTVIGTAAGRGHGQGSVLHWGARREGQYVDPLSLLGPWRPALVGPGGWVAADLPPAPRYDPWDGVQHFGFVPGSREATGPGWVVAPNPNHVVGVAGLGSDTDNPALDLTHLGYAADDVSSFSYAGLGGDGQPLPYGPPDTWRGVLAAAERLQDHLREQWRRHPGQAVDLVGHSMGGVVALTYLLTMHDPTDPTLPPIAHVVTLSSPLEGADLASLLVGVRQGALGLTTTEVLSALVGDHDAGSQAVRDLAVGSSTIETLEEEWRRSHDEPWSSPLATGTQVMTFGGSRDPVVPEHRSDLPGADHAVLPGGHDAMRHTEAARIAVRAFLADEPVPGEAGGVGSVLSHPLSWVDEFAATVPFVR